MTKNIWMLAAILTICGASVFTACTLLCMRWKNVGDDTEKRESWEIASIEDGKMKWTALCQNADGSTYTTTFEMTKVK